MYCTQCVFLSFFPFAIVIYAFGFVKYELNYSPTLDHCVKVHFEKVQEICSRSLEKSSPDTNESYSAQVSTIFTTIKSSSTSSPATIIQIKEETTFPPKSERISTPVGDAPTTISRSSSTSSTHLRENDPWWTCPEPGKGRQSIMISALVKGRLGNVVWSYLSVLVTAKMFNLRPVLHNTTVEFLVRNAFEIESIRIPTLEWLDRKCNMSGWPQRAVSKVTMSKTLRSRDDLFQALEKYPKSGLGMLRYKNYVTATEFLVPHFYELKNELVLKKDKMVAAQEELHKVRTAFSQHLSNKTEFEFVSVHVRRTDYMHHMNKIHRNGKVATPKFFHAAMDWLIKELNTTVMFIVISDDRNWTQANIVADRKDVFLAGNSDISNPGADLAILAACNHTIFAYGTFGLTGAFLASQPGGYTIIFDPESLIVTKEMEFASNLPGWRIMMENGNFTYTKNRIDYAFYLHPRTEVGKNA